MAWIVSSLSQRKGFCLLILSVVLVLMVWMDTKFTLSISAYRFFSGTTQNNHYTRNATNDNSKSINSVSINGTKRTNENHCRKNMVCHVRFLKVYKAGSTTVQNMLFRFALRHNLIPLLPKSGNHIYSKHKSIWIPASEHFDIFAIHTKYSKQWFDSILPKDSVNIAIVRDPAERLISAAYFYRDIYQYDYLKVIPKENFIHNLVRQPEIYETATFSKTKNSMGQDFGFSTHLSVNDSARIMKYLEFLNREFKFVMIMEQFETSLVLLRRLLNWSLRDIIFLQANQQSHQTAVLEPYELTKLKTTCFLDYAIYNFFLERFEEKVKKESPSLEYEIANFNTTLSKVKSYCDGIDNGRKSLQILRTKWNEEFTISGNDCTLMKTPELNLINKLRQRHGEMYSKLKPAP